MENYTTWRWRAAYKTRGFLWNTIGFQLAFSWFIGALYSGYCTAYYSSYGKDHRSRDCNSDMAFGFLLEGLPPSVGGAHIFIVVWASVNEWYCRRKGNNKFSIMHSTQGMRFLESWLFSGLCCSCFIASSWIDDLDTYIGKGDVFLSFCITQFTTPFFGNHLGLPYEYTPYVWGCTLIMWLVAALAPQATWIANSYIPIDLAIVFMAGFIILVSEACHELHMSSKFGWYSRLRKIMGNSTLPTLVSSDVASSLTVVNQRLEKLDSLLHESGMSIWIPVHTGKNGTTVGYRFEKQFSLMYEARLLCRALRATTVEPLAKSFMDNDELIEQRFAFSQMCMYLFAMLEASRGQALALFSAEETPEIFFTGKEGLILMILYLLIVEAVDDNPIFGRGVVMVKCHQVQGSWYVSVTIARAYANLRGGAAGGGEDEEKAEVDRSLGLSEEEEEEEEEDDNAKFQGHGHQGVSRRGNGKYADAESISNKIPEGSITSSTSRLAARLSQRYLHTKIETQKNTMKNTGVVFTEHLLPVEGVIPSIMGAEAHSGLLQEKQTWLFIVDDYNSRHLFKDNQLVRNLERLSVPFETCKLDLVDSLEKRHNIVVVEYKTFLSYRSKFAKVLRQVALKVFILSDRATILSDQRISEMSGEFKSKYGIEGRRISDDITLHQLLQLVHSTASTLEPRALIQNPSG